MIAIQEVHGNSRLCRIQDACLLLSNKEYGTQVDWEISAVLHVQKWRSDYKRQKQVYAVSVK